MTDYLDCEGVYQLAIEMDPQFLACRTGRHRLSPDNSVYNPVYLYNHNTYKCACGLIKHEITTSTFPFRVLDSWPDYPEGYLLHGVGRIAGEGMDVLKGVQMQRVFAKPARMKMKEARETPPPRTRAKVALGITETTDATVVDIRSRQAG